VRFALPARGAEIAPRALRKFRRGVAARRRKGADSPLAITAPFAFVLLTDGGAT